MEAIKELLFSINSMVEKYEKISVETGANFNLFNIINVQQKEIVHSAFIAELLSPQGSHGYRELFLELFLEAKSIEFDANSLKNATIKVEKATEKSRRIDIYITIPNEKNIIIENKIYADDQCAQLRDYHEFDKNAHLIYLTLDGKEPTEYSTKNEEEKNKNARINPILMSYKADIKNWLEKCLLEAALKPFVRENIAQYLNIIKYLTHQSIYNEMKNEILEMLLSNPKLSKGYFQLIDNINRDEYQAGIFNKIKSKLTFPKDYKEEKSDLRGTLNFWRYKEGDDLCIFVEFQEDEEGISRVGIAHLNTASPSLDTDNIKKIFLNLGFDEGKCEEWICYKEILSWSKTPWADIIGNIDEIAKEIQNVIDEIHIYFLGNKPIVIK